MRKVLLIPIITLIVLMLVTCAAASGESNSGNTEDTTIIVVIVISALALSLISGLTITEKIRRNQKVTSYHMSMNKYLNDYDPSHEETFEEKLRRAKIDSQKDITFGQNHIAIDNIKMKLFIQSPKAIDGVLLDFKDIVSYEIIKDGKVIGQPGEIADNTAEADKDGIICSDLSLIIKTKKTSDSEVILPFIAFSIDSKFAYKEALGAAREAAETLDGIIR